MTTNMTDLELAKDDLDRKARERAYITKQLKLEGYHNVETWSEGEVIHVSAERPGRGLASEWYNNVTTFRLV
jgi:hypothetical protein